MDQTAWPDSERQRSQAQRAIPGDAPLSHGGSSASGEAHRGGGRPRGSGRTRTAVDSLRNRAITGRASDLLSAVLDHVEPSWRDDPREAAWLENLEKIVRFRDANGFLPRRDGDLPDERRLYRWLINRRREGRGFGSGAAKFARDQRGQLLDERIPGWDSGVYTDRWEESLAEVLAFVAEHGRLPAARAADPHEGRLGMWLAQQRYETSRGRPGAERRSARLNAALPGWMSPGLADFEAKLGAVAQLVQTHGRFPLRSDDDPEMSRAGKWLLDQRAAAAAANPRGRFVQQGREQILDDRLPGWRG